MQNAKFGDRIFPLLFSFLNNQKKRSASTCNFKKIIFLVLLFLVGVFCFGNNFSFQADNSLKASLPLAEANESSESESSSVLEVNLFYSETCSHCADEIDFLNKIKSKYQEVEFNYYSIAEEKELLNSFYKEYNVSKKEVGIVPVTFIGNDYLLGFNESKAKQIEKTIKEELKGENGSLQEDVVQLPIIGEINTQNYSLPALAVIMGALDGFNVCSLGALVLILSLVLGFRDRKKTLLLGGIFLFTTGIVYGILIFLWYKLFSFLNAYLQILQILVGILALVGGGYFLKQFIKSKKEGVSCDFSDTKVVKKLTEKVEDSLKNSKRILVMVGSIFLFALAITVVEFPCSAAVPVVFAGILAQAELSQAVYIMYLSIFVIFYLLDEIIVFLIAVLSRKVWVMSPKVSLWFNLIGAILLFGLGLYYLFLSLA